MKAIGVILTSDVGATGQSPLRLTKIGACAGAHVLAFAKVGAHSCAPLQLKRGTGGMSEDGKAKLPKGWVWATVGQLSDETRAVTYGVIKLGEPVENGIPTLRSKPGGIRMGHSRGLGELLFC